MRVLIAEDEKNLNKLIKKALEKEGLYVDACLDGQDALDHFLSASYDAAILDIMMPKIDGITLVKTVRAKKISTPILLLTAKDSIEDRVNGLDAGADDYLIKPFDFKELMARIRSITRKYSSAKTSILSVGTLQLNRAERTVLRDGKLIELSAKEFALLELLMVNAGQVLTRSQIEESIYDFDYEGASNVVDVYISFLRKKIDASYEKKYIHTIRGVGFSIKE